MVKKRIHDSCIIILGSFILAVSLFHIHFQNNLTDGGFVGIAMLIKHMTNISPSITTIVMDIPFILIGIRLLGKKMVSKTLLGAVSFSGFYLLMEKYSPFQVNLSDHLLVAAIIGGILVGLGIGMILRVGGATGGDDIASILLSKFSNISVGTSYFVLDAVVLLVSLVYLDWKDISYTLISVLVCAKITDFVYYYQKNKTQPKTS